MALAERNVAAERVRPRGLRVLLVGPSTAVSARAAGAVAARLGRDLCRIDLSRVVSKYIGETEKNLRRLFDAAEAGEWVLFFDEADALFGRRTDVSDSHDRYANVDVSYVRRRIAAHAGVVVVACGDEEELDPALLRRFEVVLEIPKGVRPVPPRRRRR